MERSSRMWMLRTSTILVGLAGAIVAPVQSSAQVRSSNDPAATLAAAAQLLRSPASIDRSGGYSLLFTLFMDNGTQSDAGFATATADSLLNIAATAEDRSGRATAIGLLRHLRYGDPPRALASPERLGSALARITDVVTRSDYRDHWQPPGHYRCSRGTAKNSAAIIGWQSHGRCRCRATRAHGRSGPIGIGAAIQRGERRGCARS